MAYDEMLAERLRERLSELPDMKERKMFGGLSFLVRGHMTLTANRRGGLMVRVGEEQESELLERPGVERVEMRDREMPGWLHVDVEQVATEAALEDYVVRALAFNETLSLASSPATPAFLRAQQGRSARL